MEVVATSSMSSARLLIFLGYVFCTPESETENWTLGLSWDSKLNEVQGFLHGLQSSAKDILVRVMLSNILILMATFLKMGYSIIP